MKTSKLSIQKLTAAALFTAVTIVLAQISVMTPWGVPFTLQTFAIALCGYVLGARMGLASVITYIIMGAVGVPVFSNFRGGLNMLFGLTGGFIFGFIPFVLLCGIGSVRKSAILKISLGLIGLAICHILGILQFSFITASNLQRTFMLVSFPYLVKDLISVLGAYYLSMVLKRTVPRLI